MRKSFFCLTVFISIAFSGLSQDKYSAGIFAGVPNNDNFFLYKEYNGTDSTITDYSTLGLPVSIGVHYFVEKNERMNFGLEVNYALSGYKYNYVDTVFTNTGAYLETFDYSFKKSQLRFLLRGNYNFVQREKIKMYVGGGVGYKHIFRTTKSNQPGYIEATTKNSIPFTGRIAVGFKVYPIEKVGIFGEAGVFGGSLFQVGVCFRQQIHDKSEIGALIFKKVTLEIGVKES